MAYSNQTFETGTAQPKGLETITVRSSAAVAKGIFVEVTPGATPSVAAYDGAEPGGIVGISLNAATASGQDVLIAIRGTAAVTCDATGVHAYAFVSSDSNGKAEAADIDADYVLGVARSEGAAAGTVLVELNGLGGSILSA